MAILLKEKIDALVEENKAEKYAKRNRMVIQLNGLIDDVLSLSNDCNDILDTEAYLKECGLSFRTLKFQEEYFVGSVDKVSIHSGSIAIAIILDYQGIVFTSERKFCIKCAEALNGAMSWESLDIINFDNHSDYYLEQAIKVITLFINEFDCFMSNYLKCING